MHPPLSVRLRDMETHDRAYRSHCNCRYGTILDETARRHDALFWRSLIFMRHSLVVAPCILTQEALAAGQLREVHGRTPTLDLNMTLIRFSK